MRRILIVSPHFPPVNAPDHQRVRMALPYLEEHGWIPHVLTVHPDYVNGISDPLLEKSLPRGVEVTRVKALPIQWTKFIGLGDLALRAWPYLLKAGSLILSKRKYDLIYFSTTMFTAMALGPLWLRKFGVPYVIDFQDLWVSDYYNKPGSPSPPGGRLKYGIHQLIARALEPKVIKQASHIISVSPGYVETLAKRYSWLRQEQFTVLPFGAAEEDFNYLRQKSITQSHFNPKDGNKHWVYVGRGGDDMAFSVRAFFSALQIARKNDPGKFSRLKLHFIGTDYAPSDRSKRTIEPRAKEYGVNDLVEETPRRVPYFEALQCLLDADALIVPGSDDPDYTASKIYPYILARKPLLAIFHENSSVVGLLQKTKAGAVVTFKSGDEISKIAQSITSRWFQNLPASPAQIDWDAFEPYTVRKMASRQSAIFDQSISCNLNYKNV